MPVPTDTYWNIKRLNRVFAGSALALLAVTFWAVSQDYFKSWREPQVNARVWEAALLHERIDAALPAERQARVEELERQIAERTRQIEQHDEVYRQLSARRQVLQGEKDQLEFSLNNLKSEVTVMESQLQDAITAQDQVARDRIAAKLEGPRQRVNEGIERIAGINEQIAELRTQMSAQTAELDALRKQHKQLTGDYESYRKKLATLEPQSWGAWGSSLARRAPLLQFLNPSERIQQVVVADVKTDLGGLKRVDTIDRCMTCHVNIGNRDYEPAKLLAYLEEQVATGRRLKLPEGPPTRATDPQATRTSPGAVAMGEFWHAWAQTLAPGAIAKNNFRISTLAGMVGTDKPVTVTVDGQALDTFKYNAKATDPAEIERQLAIVGELVSAWTRYDPASAEPLVRRSRDGKIQVTIAAGVEEKAAGRAVSAALIYPQVIRDTLEQTLPAPTYDTLVERYRVALLTELNGYRRQENLPSLDSSRVLMAHPRLDLYANVDSPHSFEAVGCTSCHDGSGQETDFVLAAHTPRAIWVDERTGVPVLGSQIQGQSQQQHPPTMASMLAAVYPEGAESPHASGVALQLGEPVHATGEVPPDAPASGYVDPVNQTQGTAIPQARYWQAKYEAESGTSFKDVVHYWDTPMRPPQYIEANCVRCHVDVHDIRQTAPKLHAGRELFQTMGCVNCHQMQSIPANQNRQVGTDLRHVNEKLSPAFINTWVWAPKSFRPSTKMPHFFMLENNSSDEELRRTRVEARAMTEYLVQTATPLPPAHVLPAGIQGDRTNGQKLFNSLGCLGCHTNLNETGEAWITTDLVKRAGLSAEEAATAYQQMNYNERQLYAEEHFPPPAGNDLPTYNDSERTPRPIFMHHGPELSGIGTKLTAGKDPSIGPDQARAWLYDWLKDPRHYSGYTVMPNLRLSDQEAADLAEYLLDQKRTNTDPDDTWQAGLAPSDPQKLRELVGLLLRNRTLGSVARADELAINDAEMTLLAADALVTPTFTFKAAEQRVASMPLEQKQLLFLGKKMIGHYGCMSCHAINGTETLSSPCTNLSDWGKKAVSKLDFAYLDEHKAAGLPATSSVPMVNGLSPEASTLAHAPVSPGQAIATPVEVAWPHVGHDRALWLTQKLRNTRIFDRGMALREPGPNDPGKPYDKLKMPTFYLNEEQVEAIVTFVLSNRELPEERLVSERMVNRATDSEDQVIARGRYLTEKYNCVGCHQTEFNTPAIQRFYASGDVGTKAPPSLRGEGNKIQHAWLFNFLKHVEPLRPLPVIRMPSFPVEDEEATALAAYFAVLSQAEARQLQHQLDPVTRYIAFAEKQEAPNLKYGAAGNDWFTRPEFASARDALVKWAYAARQLKEAEIDPWKNSPEELGKAYRMILYRARFTRRLYDAPYPFVDAPRPQISPERFALGEQFLFDMQCLKCHVLGDPSAPGARADATAPNLGLAHRRLQSRWIRHWVQEPPVIQPGTAMPAFFTGEAVLDLHGQSWPVAQNIQEPMRSQIEAKYGKTAQEQIDLLLDYLYAAGMRNHTAVQPAGTPDAPAGTPATGDAPPTTAPSGEGGDL